MRRVQLEESIVFQLRRSVATEVPAFCGTQRGRFLVATHLLGQARRDLQVDLLPRSGNGMQNMRCIVPHS